MFFSITNLFSVQIKSRTGGKDRWHPCEDEGAVKQFIYKMKKPFKVVTVFNEGVYTVTSRFAKRFIWGGWGVLYE